jgi:Cu(I)/Ag(I) efflux system membrane fusion protein
MKEKGRFEPKSVSLGTNTGELTEIVEGIEEGETIVTSANFLIDSESRLRAAIRNSEPAPSKSERSGTKP